MPTSVYMEVPCYVSVCMNGSVMLCQGRYEWKVPCYVGVCMNGSVMLCQRLYEWKCHVMSASV